MQLLTLGLNHTTAPVAVREKVAFQGDALPRALAGLRDRLASQAPETAILSTCNRTEIYCVTEDAAATQARLSQWLDEQAGRTVMPGHLYALPDAASVRHAFRVACGLDSMVLGEPQILGQMKQAVRAAQEAGSLGTYLHQLFQRSFSVAKQVRTSTEIGVDSVSLAAAGVKLAKRVFGPLEQSKVLFIGAGEMIELCAAHFASQSPECMVVANRTVERGERLAAQFGAQAIALTELPKRFAEFDVVVTCTASSLPIIGLGLVERALAARRRRPMVIIDLAVPRDVEPEVGRVADVFLYTVDDLGRLVEAANRNRQAAVHSAEAIIESQVGAFLRWLSTRASVPQIQALHARAQTMKLAEIERARRLFARTGDTEQALLSLANAMTAKFLHAPLRLLQQPDDPGLGVHALIDQLIPEVK